MAEKTLADLAIGEEGTVLRVEGPQWIRTRLIEMGLVRGTHIRLLGRAPLGDPLEVKVRGFSLALRKSEARHVRLETAGPARGNEESLPP